MAYVELNPVRASLVAQAAEWPRSSVRAHLAGRDDALVEVAGLLSRFGSWRDVLGESLSAAQCDLLRNHTRLGRLLASAQYTELLERETGRRLVPRRRGRPRKVA